MLIIAKSFHAPHITKFSVIRLQFEPPFCDRAVFSFVLYYLFSFGFVLKKETKIFCQVVEGEGVTAVHFADSFPGKNNFDLSKCLYIGTSLGSVLVIVIVVPEADTR